MEVAHNRIDPEAVLANNLPQGYRSYTERDVALYALGIGACGADPCDPIELSYVYNPQGQAFIKVLPTFAILFSFNTSEGLPTVPGLNFNPSLALHGEQFLEIYKPLPTSGQVNFSTRISQLLDKGKAAILETENICRDAVSGEVLCMSRNTNFLRGAGGFSKSTSNRYSYDARTPSVVQLAKLPSKTPNIPPSAVYEDCIQPSQALLYCLSGDYNPLHSDPKIATAAGFSRPILHGLCTLGFAIRAVIRCCAGEPSLIQTIQGRFLLHVYPGETLATEMWKDHTCKRIMFLCKVKERAQAVLFGQVALHSSSCM